ncbi:hypothetical protein EXIGLDRAFT_654425, partial [Exidia glandulosa HHB12029]
MAAYKAVATSYTSREVSVDPEFLSTPSKAPDAAPIAAYGIDFRDTELSQRGEAYAVVLDNVLSPSECAKLLSYAECSSTNQDKPWQPALVNTGPGRETLIPDYRNSERIIWDNQRLMDLLWTRCLQAEGLEEDIVELDSAEKPHVLGVHAKKKQRWRFTRLNERMRFLRYEKGMFFREHCDGSYWETKTGERSFYTLHLYLDDSIEGLSSDPFASKGAGSSNVELSGGATTFYTDDMKAQIDVFPRAGRVLIFQHRALLHAGADVHAGVKYTMRTDLMF